MLKLFLLVVLVILLIIFLNKNRELFSVNNNFLKELCPELLKTNPYYHSLEKVIDHNKLLIDQNNAIIEKYEYTINNLEKNMKKIITQDIQRKNFRKEHLEQQIRCNNRFKTQIDNILI